MNRRISKTFAKARLGSTSEEKLNACLFDRRELGLPFLLLIDDIPTDLHAAFKQEFKNLITSVPNIFVLLTSCTEIEFDGKTSRHTCSYPAC